GRAAGGKGDFFWKSHRTPRQRGEPARPAAPPQAAGQPPHREKDSTPLSYGGRLCAAAFRSSLCRLGVKLRSHGSKMARPVYLRQRTYLISVATALSARNRKKAYPIRSPRRRARAE